MKKQKILRLDLRGFTKSVREEIIGKKEEANNLLFEDVGKLFSASGITQESFKCLFKKHAENIFVRGAIDVDKIKFKSDNTPDLRTVPIAVREIFKSFNTEAEKKKSASITELISKLTDLNELPMLKRMGKEKPFVNKWIGNSVVPVSSKELVETEDDFFANF